ncbi:MAG: bifunctional UDP-N-acetylglucosamine diphosphorylase/glucosamine-1-phosphate N-acetyltransferase GlmU [Oligoflexia bacterium]|nr:bifunctional UDP-N-acetylglucosamine diphosphorylase/glucosamine-1-phosphate N-acetyltransferase GlmU [Oligoflexia bacterium]
MKSDLPKVLHKACGESLLFFVMRAAKTAGTSSIITVLGFGRELVEKEIESEPTASAVYQPEQKGTGNAVEVALSSLPDGPILIVNGDGPLIQKETIQKMLDSHFSSSADLTLGVAHVSNPFGYGRVITKDNQLLRIVEEKDATNEERKISLINGGIYLVNKNYLQKTIPNLKPSKVSGEIYLTDIVAMGASAGAKLQYCELDFTDLLGVNDLLQLSQVEEILRKRILETHQKNGVRIENPSTVWIEAGVECGIGTKIEQSVSLKGRTRIAANCTIGTGSVIYNSELSDEVEVLPYCVIDRATILTKAVLGPYARIRPETKILKSAKIGNFVEIKKTTIGEGSKVNHLSYVGDAQIGSGVNIGCGFVACNYDGFQKHITQIDDGAFIGSGVEAVAPIQIGKNSYVATGSTLTKNVPEDALAIARTKQENKEGYAPKIKSRLNTKKAKG